MTRVMRWTTWVALCPAPRMLSGQTSDTTKPYTLPPTTVSVTRTAVQLTKVPLSIHSIDRAQISRAKPTWGLDEALANVPGVYVANRYNFSQDQRISIRGFGARSAFAVRGIKILVDGIPQTLPDCQGQLTNPEIGEFDRLEWLRGSATAPRTTGSSTPACGCRLGVPGRWLWARTSATTHAPTIPAH